MELRVVSVVYVDPTKRKEVWTPCVVVDPRRKSPRLGLGTLTGRELTVGTGPQNWNGHFKAKTSLIYSEGVVKVKTSKRIG